MTRLLIVFSTAVSGLIAAVSVGSDPPEASSSTVAETTVAETTGEQETAPTPVDISPLTVAEARRQAKLLHETYLATLHVVHREYFDERERDTLPARAFEEVFKQIDERTNGRTRWISVNTPAMNVDHEPKPGFEQDAAKALSNGSEDYERAADGFYHRAGAVGFRASCTRCHLSGLSQRRAGRVAALVITLPVRDR